MPYLSMRARYGTWYRSDDPNRAFYNFRSYLAVRANGPVMHSYVYFHNPFNFPGAVVQEAKLYLYMQGGTTNPGTRSISVQRVAKGMDFVRMTYNKRPTQFSGPTSSKSTTGPLSGNHQFEIDITASMQAVANGDPFYGFIITTTAPFVIQFHGAQTSTPPSLFVRYAYPPTPPQDLSPAGNRVVGITKPTVGFSYYDVSGEEKISKVQVQTAATSSGFGSPAWDSGEVTATTPSLDLATTSFPARTSGQKTWWRVRARSSAGVWSPWSAPVPFRYIPHQTVTITNPTPPTFSDPTPPITWTSTGTKARWAASLRMLRDGKLTTIDHSGTRTGADQTWTPTKGAEKVGIMHRVYVDVYDDHDREATPGDHVYANDSVDSIFTPSTTIAAPTDLRVTDSYPRPEVALNWFRSELPDKWNVYRDGKYVKTLTGVEARVGVTNRYEYRPRSGGGTHRWFIRAVVNGKVSERTNEVTHEANVKGLWLYDEDDNAVCIQDDREHDFNYVEVSAIHEPLNSDRVIIVTQSLRGREGPLSGLITPLKGQAETPEKWLANLFAFKERPGRPLELVIEGETVPVIIRAVKAKLDPAGRPRTWQVSLEAYQQGGTPFDATMGG